MPETFLNALDSLLLYGLFLDFRRDRWKDAESLKVVLYPPISSRPFSFHLRSSRQSPCYTGFDKQNKCVGTSGLPKKNGWLVLGLNVYGMIELVYCYSSWGIMSRY